MGRRQGGFTAVPHADFAGLLCLPLTRRELSALLLVARLTYGCRNARWARLTPADFAAVGIRADHAAEVLQSLLQRGLLGRNGLRDEYRLEGLDRSASDREAARRGMLTALVARQLRPPSHNGSRTVPKWEASPSRNGNASAVLVWRFDRSQRRFVAQMDAAIDKDR